MNPRELFNQVASFKKPSRMPLFTFESVEGPTIDRWHTEGLPKDKWITEFFGLDTLEYVWLNFFPRITAEPVLIEEDAEYKIERDTTGITVKYLKSNPAMVFQYLKHPVESRKDWEDFKRYLDPLDPSRHPADWGPGLIARHNASTNPVGLLLYPLFFRRAFYLLGMERFMLAFYDDPDLIHDIFEHSARFALALMDRLLKDVRLDFVTIAEDMAFKHSTHVSPAFWQEFWVPHLAPVMDWLKGHGVKVISMWSSGDIRPLLPDFIKSGFNCFWPMESVTGMDVREIRAQYGKSAILCGNISKESLIAGKRAIRDEVMAKVPAIVAQGGYFPAADEIVPPEVSFENFSYYINLLKEIRL